MRFLEIMGGIQIATLAVSLGIGAWHGATGRTVAPGHDLAYSFARALFEKGDER
jgi:hypothetical protein